jgi:hypothetical protein
LFNFFLKVIFVSWHLPITQSYNGIHFWSLSSRQIKNRNFKIRDNWLQHDAQVSSTRQSWNEYFKKVFEYLFEYSVIASIRILHIRIFREEYSLFTSIVEYFKKVLEYLFEYSIFVSIRTLEKTFGKRSNLFVKKYDF